MSCVASTAQNLDHAADLVRDAARDGGQIICLPELFRAQYFCQREDHALFALAEPIPGPSTERLAALCPAQRTLRAGKPGTLVTQYEFARAGIITE